MQFKTLISLIPFLSVAFGQTIEAFAKPTGTASAPVPTKTFSVGANGRTFTPHEHTANVGDIIEFRFYPQNHSIVKAAFGPDPCIPYEMTGAGRVGIFSGWMPVNIVTSTPPIFRIRINDTEPLFVYCSSPGACLAGMIAVVNPNATFTYEAQLAFTENATVALSPGEFFPEEKLDPSTTRGASQPTSSSSSGIEPHPHRLSTGAIAGIAVGGAIGLALFGLLLFMCGRQKSIKETIRNFRPKEEVYKPSSPGLSEAQYPNMQKSPVFTDGARHSAQTYGTESYRSVSPQLDERTQQAGMVGMMMNTQHGHGHASVSSFGNNGWNSPPGTGTISSGWPSPAPKYDDMHEMDQTAGLMKNIRPTNSPPPVAEVHELPASASERQQVSRNFSFVEGNQGYARTDDKT